MRLIKVSRHQLAELNHGDVEKLFAEASMILWTDGENCELKKLREGLADHPPYPGDICLVVTHANITRPQTDDILRRLNDQEENGQDQGA